MISRLSRLAVCAAAVAAVAVLPACGGGGGNKDACKKVMDDIKASGTSTVNNMSSGSALAQSYRDSAAKLRADAKGGNSDLKSAAGKLADAYEATATRMADLSGATTGSGLPDTSAVTQAAGQITQADSKVAQVCHK